VGLRPSPGRIAHGGTGTKRRPLDTLVVEGPMARDVRDCALFLDAMAAAHPQDPLSFDPPREAFANTAARPALPKRIAFGVDLGGAAIVEPAVAEVVTAAMKRIAAAGSDVVEASPDFRGVADAAYDLRRGFTLQRHTRETFEATKAMMSPILRKTVEDSFGLTLEAYLAAEARQQKLVADLRDLLNTYDVFALPTLQQVPYKARGTPSESGKFKHWAEAALTRYGLTLSWCPAISVPCGRTADGRSIGLQLVGRPRGEAALLAQAAAIEDLLGEAARVPVTPAKQGVPA
jgi:amidase